MNKVALWKKIQPCVLQMYMNIQFQLTKANNVAAHRRDSLPMVQTIFCYAIESANERDEKENCLRNMSSN